MSLKNTYQLLFKIFTRDEWLSRRSLPPTYRFKTEHIKNNLLRSPLNFIELVSRYKKKSKEKSLGRKRQEFHEIAPAGMI